MYIMKIIILLHHICSQCAIYKDDQVLCLCEVYFASFKFRFSPITTGYQMPTVLRPLNKHFFLS